MTLKAATIQYASQAELSDEYKHVTETAVSSSPATPRPKVKQTRLSGPHSGANCVDLIYETSLNMNMKPAAQTGVVLHGMVKHV